MKKYWMSFVFLSLAACSQKQVVPFEAVPEGQLSLVVNVDGIQCCDGVLRMAVYNDSAYWMSDTGIVRGRLGFIAGESQAFEVHGLPAGKYAVAVFQDLDNDSTFDRWLGLFPQEPYGFSNNVGKFGPASFAKAAFDLTEDETISIQLN